MKSKVERTSLNQVPPNILMAIFTIGHYLATTVPELRVGFGIIEGDEKINYELEIREVSRSPHTIEVKATD